MGSATDVPQARYGAQAFAHPKPELQRCVHRPKKTTDQADFRAMDVMFTLNLWTLLVNRRPLVI